MSRTTIGLTLLAALAVAAPSIARAETQTYKATLSGAQEVPAKSTAGKGDATVTLDTTTKMITYTASYSGLSGPATMGHIHGPAAAGANAGVLVPFSNVTAQPVKGTATLTDAQIADLQGGKMYVNFHTAANPGGEIRGQLMK